MPFGGLLTAGGALIGGLGGALSGKSGGKDAGNAYLTPGDPSMAQNSRDRIANALSGYGAATYGGASQDAMNNPMLSQALGQGGLASQAGTQLSSLMDPNNNKLTSDDVTAYGQASGNIANQFGQAGNSLANSLSQRGLSSSNVAGSSFSGLQGNQNEALAGLQTQIAQNRIQMNQQRMGMMQNFVTQMGNQAMNAQGQAFNQKNEYNNNMTQTGFNYLNGMQGAANENLQQQQQTQKQSTAGNIMSGISGGLSMANSMGGKGGMFGAGGAGSMS